MTSAVIQEQIKNVVKGILSPESYNSFLVRGANLKYSIKKFLLRRPLTTALFRGVLYPELLSIFLTTHCNLRCFICRREEHRPAHLNFDNLTKLKQAIRHASVIDLTGWGECFLYPRFDDVISYIFSLNRNKELIRIVSNGTMLSKEKAVLLGERIDLFTISLNAASAETYNRDMKGGSFCDTLDNIREFMTWLPARVHSHVILHFVAHAGNYHEIADFVRLAADLGVKRVTIGHYLINTEDHLQYSLLSLKQEYNDAIRDARGVADTLAVDLTARTFGTEKQASFSTCRDPVLSCYLEPDGRVAPCCHCGSYHVGNVYRDGFESVWFGEEYRKLRDKMHIPACRRCTPFVPLDDPRSHFTGVLKDHDEHVAIQTGDR
jgi:MoaA/NifB/PqqE/SkfB family radical SAM enzyme